MTGNSKKDFDAANAAAGYKETPEGMTWHHNQDGETMQLVPKELNDGVPHTGGAAVARSAQEIAEQTGLMVASIVAPSTTEAVQNNPSVKSVTEGVIKDFVDPGVSDVKEMVVDPVGASTVNYIDQVSSGSEKARNSQIPITSGIANRNKQMSDMLNSNP